MSHHLDMTEVYQRMHPSAMASGTVCPFLPGMTCIVDDAMCSAISPSSRARCDPVLQVTYRKLSGRDLRSIKPMDLMWYDVTGDDEGIEYQILDTTNETHIKVHRALAF